MCVFALMRSANERKVFDDANPILPHVRSFFVGSGLRLNQPNGPLTLIWKLVSITATTGSIQCAIIT